MGITGALIASRNRNGLEPIGQIGYSDPFQGMAERSFLGIQIKANQSHFGGNVRAPVEIEKSFNKGLNSSAAA